MFDVRYFVHRLVVDTSDDKAFLDVGFVELAVFDNGGDLDAVGDVEFGELFLVEFGEAGTEGGNGGSGECGVVATAIFERDGERLRVFATHDGDGNLVARSVERDLFLQFAHGIDLFVVDGGDDVAFLDAGICGGASFDNAMDVGTGKDVEFLFLGESIGDVGNGDTEDGALHDTMLSEIADDLLDDGGRNGERVACVGAGLRGDGGIDADEFTFRIDERAT